MLRSRKKLGYQKKYSFQKTQKKSPLSVLGVQATHPYAFLKGNGEATTDT